MAWGGAMLKGPIPNLSVLHHEKISKPGGGGVGDEAGSKKAHVHSCVDKGIQKS